jgi:DeoR family transcriptional regulator of aga operon
VARFASDGSAAPAQVRRERILALLQKHEFVRVSGLGSEFGVSDVTIRGDLEALSREGQITRFRGGAVARASDHQERPFEMTAESFALEKEKIGVQGAAHLSPGRSLILDVGTTTTAVARALIAREDLRELQVFTNALNIAIELESAIPRFGVVVLGGTLRPLQHSLVDPFGGPSLEKLNADFLFLGCNGVDSTGITNINAPETDMKRRMMLSARQKIVVADGSKLGVVELVRLCGLDEVDLLNTDESADPEVLDELRESGLEIEIAR